MDGQHPEGIRLELLIDERSGVVLELQPSQRRLDDELPGAGHAEQNLVRAVRDQLLGSFGKLGVAGHPPQERVGVQQQFHPNQFWMSSGSGSSKSTPILTRPRAVPGTRRPTPHPMGTSFATGRPALEIVTSSPRATRSRSFEKCVFASWMLTGSMELRIGLSAGLSHPAEPALLVS